LLASIARDRVIPIVGPALSVVEVGDRTLTVDRYVAERLSERLGLSPGDLRDDFGLEDVVAAHIRRRGVLEDLYPRINAILKSAKLEPPPALGKLAAIPNFRLFVTTAYDPLLEMAIRTARGADCRTLGYVPSEMPDCDLPLGARTGSTATVYHLLGSASPLPEFAICDDDLLEYMIALQSDRQPLNLFDELSRHYLLVLGGNLSDWLYRLFLRLAKRQRLSGISRRSSRLHRRTSRPVDRTFWRYGSRRAKKGSGLQQHDFRELCPAGPGRGKFAGGQPARTRFRHLVRCGSYRGRRGL
jgi:hypothetical protein